VKFHLDRADGVHLISQFGDGRIRVDAAEHATSVLVPWRGDVQRWDVDAFDALQSAHFDAVLALQPEIVIFGSGGRLRFPRAALLRALIERGIGVETMDTSAACRTYNVLAAEGRSVVAALLLEACER
jgi:uncharacterized protein